LQQAEQHIRAGRYAPAAEAYAKYLRSNPRHPAHARLSLRYAQLLMKSGRFEKAIDHLKKLIRRDGRNTDALYALVQAQAHASRIDDATRTLDTLLALDPDHAEGLARHAIFLQYAGRTGEALAVIEGADGRGLRHWSLELSFAEIAPLVGREEDAIGRLRAYLDRGGLDREEHTAMLFSLGTLLDRVGRCDEAWEAVSAGNRMMAAPAAPEGLERGVERAIERIDAEAIRAMPKPVDPARDVVLVLGSPRSGTTLIEQILAAHPEAESAGEMDALRHAASTLTGSTDAIVWTPGRLREADVIRASGLFLADLRARAGKARRRIDKTPHNWQHLGVAARMLPEARAIYCERDPRDVAVSCYFRMFVTGQEYTTRLDWIGRYLAATEKLMRHWERTIRKATDSFRVTRARYEQVVENTEEETRRLVEFVGLDWHESCLRFHEQRRVSVTLSSDQVGRGVHSGSVARWRRYEKHLGPLIEAMGDEAPKD